MLPNGLHSQPRKFTNLMKHPIATLRINGYIVAIHIDDFINVGLIYQECVSNIMASIQLLDSLGFIIHPDKPSFMPKQNITFLAFNIFQEIRKYHLPKQEALWLYCHKVYSSDYWNYNIQPTRS